LSFTSSKLFVIRLLRNAAAQAIEAMSFAAPYAQRKLAQSARLHFDRDQAPPELR